MLRKKICTNLDNLDWGGGGGGGSLGLIGLLTAVAIFSLKDCEIPRRPNLVELAEELKASLIDGLEFIRMRVVSLNKCELLTSPAKVKRNSELKKYSLSKLIYHTR